jgi:heme exporter protein D
MNWNSPAEFFAMGGHGYFVWMSYGAAVLLMVAEPLLARARQRAAVAAAARMAETESGDPV